MKKLITALTLGLSFLLSTSLKAQYVSAGINVVDTTYRWFILNTPGLIPTMITKDSTYVSFKQNTVKFDSLNYRRNNGKPYTIAWLDSLGNMKTSPIDSVVLSLYYNKVASDNRYLQIANYDYFTLPNKPSRFVTNGITRSFNTAFIVSSTHDASVVYTIQVVSTLSLTSGQSGTVFLESSPNNSTWSLVTQSGDGNTGLITIGLNTAITVSGMIGGYIPANYYIRLRTTGTGTITYITGQELLY